MMHTHYPISIHAPRAGSDVKVAVLVDAHVISIHAPRAGSDKAIREELKRQGIFQSTLPVRGATVKTRIIIRIFK